jgi:flagellar motor switch protein FliN
MTDPAASANDNARSFVQLWAESLRFAGRNILLREILELGAGSVLKLDREIQDPADLLLDGRLIARGEVVVVDGNFGLRVTEVHRISASRVEGADARA